MFIISILLFYMILVSYQWQPLKDFPLLTEFTNEYLKPYINKMFLFPEYPVIWSKRALGRSFPGLVIYSIGYPRNNILFFHLPCIHSQILWTGLLSLYFRISIYVYISFTYVIYNITLLSFYLIYFFSIHYTFNIHTPPLNFIPLGFSNIY